MAAAIVPCKLKPSAAGELRRCSCWKNMHSPKLLDCLHVLGTCCSSVEVTGEAKDQPGTSFSFGLLSRRVPDTVLTCKVCGAETKVPEGKRELLPDPNFLMLLVAAKNTSQGLNPSCEQCDSSKHEAIARCQQCAQFVCQKAYRFHKQVPSLKSHVIVDLHHVTGQPSLESNCRKHEHLLEFFCIGHDLPICAKCKVNEHPSCKHVNLDDHMRNVKASLKASAQHLRVATTAIRTNLEGRSEVEGSSQFQQAATEIEQGVTSYLKQEEFLLRRTTQMLKAGSKEEQLKLHKLLQKPRKIESVFRKNVGEGELCLMAVNTTVDADKIQPCVHSRDLSDEQKIQRLKVGTLLEWNSTCVVTDADPVSKRWKLRRLSDNHSYYWEGVDRLPSWKLYDFYHLV